MRWRALRDDTAIEGSFCLVRKGSPCGHLVPWTMLTLGPTLGACASATLALPSTATAKAAAAREIARIDIAHLPVSYCSRRATKRADVEACRMTLDGHPRTLAQRSSSSVALR